MLLNVAGFQCSIKDSGLIGLPLHCCAVKYTPSPGLAVPWVAGSVFCAAGDNILWTWVDFVLIFCEGGSS